MSAWDDLSDDELQARLVQRCVAPELAAYLVGQRDKSDQARQQISRRLA